MDDNNQTTRISRLTIGRLHNLGSYEHIRYEVTVEIAPDDDPSRVLRTVENILNDLQAKHGISSFDLKRAKEVITKPASELSEIEKSNLELYKRRVRLYEDATRRREAAREALATLSYTSEYRDAKTEWEDDY